MPRRPERRPSRAGAWPRWPRLAFNGVLLLLGVGLLALGVAAELWGPVLAALASIAVAAWNMRPDPRWAPDRP